MNTLIFRTLAPILTVVMLAFSIFVVLRGHNEPGGGFIGGLIGAAAIAIYGMASGPEAARKALRVHPLALSGFGVVLAVLSGLPSLPLKLPYLTGLWGSVPISSPAVFDIGVYFAVFGTLAAVTLGLEDEGRA